MMMFGHAQRSVSNNLHFSASDELIFRKMHRQMPAQCNAFHHQNRLPFDYLDKAPGLHCTI